MTVRVLVCDDEKLARDRLVRLLAELDGYEVVAEAASGSDAVEAVKQGNVDLALLDIRMPGMDGLSAARAMAELETPPAIIFCTAYDEHALDALKLHAMDYLLKPVRREDLEKALAGAATLNRVQLQALGEESHDSSTQARTQISARTHKGIELIPVEQIYYFHADQKYVTVVYEGGEVLIDETLKELENEFSETFVRVHRNALVAKRYLEGMEQVSQGHYQVKIRGTETRLTVSRRHVAGLRKVMQHL